MKKRLTRIYPGSTKTVGVSSGKTKEGTVPIPPCHPCAQEAIMMYYLF